VWKVCS